MHLTARREAILVALYFTSGAVGLLDEVVFFKYLSLAFGATAYASSAVLVAFMAGLSLGAAMAGRADARVRRPLRTYGLLEIGVGLACAASPWLFAGVTRAYVGAAASIASLPVLEVLRAGLAAAVVLLPTMAMGATLPLVARFAGGSVTRLYAANTLGGATGAVAATYGILPALGLAGSVRAGACASVAVGAGAVWLARGAGAEVGAGAGAGVGAGAGAGDGELRGVRLAAGASGVLVFASEVVFVHLLALVDGTSVYVFGLVLAVFLVALSVGAAAARPMARRLGDQALAASLGLSGMVLAASVPVWDRLPDLFVAAGPYVEGWPAREAVRGLVAALAIGLPAACMGTTFPLVLGALSGRDDRGAQTGHATAINTIASVVGSLAGGFVLLPWLGSQRALGVIAVLYGAGAVALGRLRGGRPLRRDLAAQLAAVALVATLVTPRWDLARLSSGTNVYFAAQPEQGRVLWMNEDVHGGVVTVTLAPSGLHTLWTNGKYQGDDGPQMAAQRAFADIPAAFVPRYGRALVVGVGTGATVGALAGYPFTRIDLAELSPGIVKAADTFFGSVNGGVLEDPRLHLLHEDGRNVLLVAPERYDLVTVELTSIWFAGAANLYNREFYDLAKGRLTEGGILSQWIQLHHTTMREIATQMATLRAVFPRAAFFIRGDQGVLVASEAPLSARPERSGELRDRVFDEATLDAFVARTAADLGTTPAGLLSTDDDLRLEYATPRNNVPGRMSIAETSAALRAWASRAPGG